MQYNTIQYNTTQHYTTQHNTTQQNAGARLARRCRGRIWPTYERQEPAKRCGLRGTAKEEVFSQRL